MNETNVMNIRLEYEDYKGRKSIWSFPRTPKEAVRTIKKFIEFYYRCKRGKLLYRGLVETLKMCAEQLIDLMSVYLIAEPRYITIFEEILNAKPINAEAEFVEEKERIRGKKERCCVCGTDLVYPAYVVYRKGFEIVDRSAPVGIRCLNNRREQLENLAKEIKIFLNNSALVYSVKSEISKEKESEDNGQLLLF